MSTPFANPQRPGREPYGFAVEEVFAWIAVTGAAVALALPMQAVEIYATWGDTAGGTGLPGRIARVLVAAPLLALGLRCADVAARWRQVTRRRGARGGVR